MSVEMNKTYNVNITGGNNQNAFGDHSRFDMIVEGGKTIDLDEVFRAMRDSIPAVERPPVMADAIEPLREIAVGPAPQTEEEETTLKATILAYVSKLEPYVPYMRKTLAAFAEGALSTLPPPAGWVMGGVMEVVRDHRQ